MVNTVRFIINPISGINRNPRKIVKWIHEVFQSSQIEYEIVYTRKAGDGISLAKEAIERKFSLVAVVGGDGTINEVGRGLCHSDVALGVIPAGSGNGFARNFKIPLDQLKAIQMLLSPKIISIDAGRINDHLFFNVAGFGLDSFISQNFEEFGVRGPLPYFLMGTKAFLMYRAEPVKLTIDEKQIELTPLVVSIANAPEYGNGAIIAPSARPDDGLLDLSILEYLPMWKVVPNVYRLFNGTIDKMKNFRSFKIKHLKIERTSDGIIQTDGNPHMEKSILEVEILPRALRVVVGNDFPESA